MKKIRIGKDFVIRWSIFRKTSEGTEPYPLEGKALILRLENAFDTYMVTDYSVSGNVIEWVFRGYEQKATGPYTLVLIENDGSDDMVTIDKAPAFILVANTRDESDQPDDNTDIEYVDLISEASIFVSGTGGGSCDCEPIVVDAVLNADSENPLQNKVITDAITTLTDEIADLNNRLDEEFIDKNTLDAKDYATKNYVDVKVAIEIAAAITSNLNTEI